MVDGTSRYGAFIRIALPLAVPGIVVAFLFAFAFAWNEFLFGLTLKIDGAKSLPVQSAGIVALRVLATETLPRTAWLGYCRRC